MKSRIDVNTALTPSLNHSHFVYNNAKIAINATTAAITKKIGFAIRIALNAAKAVFAPLMVGVSFDVTSITVDTPPETLLIILKTGPSAATNSAHLIIISCVPGDSEFQPPMMS